MKNLLFKWATSGLFSFIFVLFKQFYTMKTVDFSGIWTQIDGVEGEHADQLTVSSTFVGRVTSYGLNLVEQSFWSRNDRTRVQLNKNFKLNCFQQIVSSVLRPTQSRTRCQGKLQYIIVTRLSIISKDDYLCDKYFKWRQQAEHQQKQ